MKIDWKIIVYDFTISFSCILKCSKKKRKKKKNPIVFIENSKGKINKWINIKLGRLYIVALEKA